MWVLKAVEEGGTKGGERHHGLVVFEVEVGGEDEPAVWRELVECAVVNTHPCLGTIPEILVAHEDEVYGGRKGLDRGEAAGVVFDECSGSVGAGWPALACFLEFGLADVYTGEVDVVGVCRERAQQ